MPNIVGLFVARILQGIGVGLSVGTGTAYLAELVGDENGPTRAANLVALATSIGFGCGPLFTDIAMINRQTLVPWSYWLLLTLLLLSLVTVFFVKTTPTLGGNLVRLPVYPKGTVPMGFSIALAWAVTGIVITVVPGQLVHFGLAGWAPVALFLVNGVGALVQPLARRFSERRSMLLGFLLIGIGTCVLTIAAWRGMVILLLLGAAIAGAACYGFTYLGGLASVSKLGGERRAGAVAGYYLFAYLGYGLPSIGTGYLADQVGMLSALLGFTAIVMAATCILAYLVGFRRSVGELSAKLRLPKAQELDANE